MIDYCNPICEPCGKSNGSCNWPCLEYSNYNLRKHMEKEDNNVQKSLKTLRNEENTVVLKKNNPYVARVTEVGISVQSGDLLGVDELKKCDKECVADYFEYDVNDDIWLYATKDNGWSVLDLLDVNGLKIYIKEKNAEYCKQEGLCEQCRSPLKEFVEMEDGMPSEIYWACKNGC